jgi:hypothetical protein
VGVIRNIIKSGISLCVPRADRLWLCQGGEGNHLGATFDAERKSGHLHEKEGLGDVTRRGGEIKISPDGRLESERERERERERVRSGREGHPLRPCPGYSIGNWRVRKLFRGFSFFLVLKRRSHINRRAFTIVKWINRRGTDVF